METAITVDANGDVWVWGDCKDYVCGYESESDLTAPTKVEGIPKAIQANLTYNTAMIVGEDGSLWGWGENVYGKMGKHRQVLNVVKTPAQLLSQDVKYIANSDYDTTFVILNNGKMYSAGYDNQQQLGRSGEEDHYSYSFGLVNVRDAMRHVGKPILDLADTLKNQQWRNGSERYFIEVRDSRIEDREKYLAELSNILHEKNIKFVGAGSSELNKHTIEQIISSNNHRGIFFESDDLTILMNKISTYILKRNPIDVVLHIGNTSQDEFQEIKQKSEDIVKKTLSSYGIEANIVVTDGERITENRLFYMYGDYLHRYDPLSDTTTKLSDIKAYKPMLVGYKIYFINTSGYYYYDLLRDKTVQLLATRITSPQYHHYVFDKYGTLYVQDKIDSENNLILKRDPNTGVFTEISNMDEDDFEYFGVTPDGNIYWVYEEEDSGMDEDYHIITYDVDADDVDHIVELEEIGRVTLNANGCLYTDEDAFASFRNTNSYAGAWKSGVFCETIDPEDESAVHFSGGENIVFYISNPDDSDDEHGLFYTDYKTGVYKKIDSYNVTILAATPDNKLYYRKSGVNYMYDKATDTKTEIASVYGGVEYFGWTDTRRVKQYTMLESLENTTWRSESDKFYVYMNDSTLTELNDEADTYYIEDELARKGITFVGLGTPSNKAQIEGFVDKQGYGTYINNTNLDAALADLTTYLIGSAGLRLHEASGTLAMSFNEDIGMYESEEIEYTTNYEDVENDSLHDDEWRFDHDPTYYENSFVSIPSSGNPIEDPITKFNLPGKYTIVYRAQDSPHPNARFSDYRKWSDSSAVKLVLYVHRKPIAKFTAAFEPDPSSSVYHVTINESSYDLDRQSLGNQGITDWEWKWKKISDVEWTEGMIPSTVPAGENYIISLRVRDLDGAWSDEYMNTYATDGKNQRPVALFTVAPTVITKSQTYSITDLSYDPDGDPISEWSWTVKKDGEPIYASRITPTAAAIKNAATNHGLEVTGSYQISLRVKDSPPSSVAEWSAPYTQGVTITNAVPVAAVTYPSSADVNHPTISTTARPVIRWTQTDSDPGTTFTGYQVQILNKDLTTIILDSSKRAQNTSSTTQSWKPSSDLPDGTVLAVRVQVKDDQDEWSVWSSPKFIEMKLNRPPTADFDWSPKPIWEGDQVQFTNLSIDPDDNALNYQWNITPPSGSSIHTTQVHPTYRWIQPGIYQVSLTASDGEVSDTVTKSVHVQALTLTAEVQHTPEWKENHDTLGHNTSVNPKDFYSGEILVVQAQSSPAEVSSLTAWLNTTAKDGTNIKVSSDLDEVSANHYKGELFDEQFLSLTAGLPEQVIDIHFEIVYANGIRKQTSVPIRIIGSVYESVGVHRRQ